MQQDWKVLHLRPTKTVSGLRCTRHDNERFPTTFKWTESHRNERKSCHVSMRLHGWREAYNKNCLILPKLTRCMYILFGSPFHINFTVKCVWLVVVFGCVIFSEVMFICGSVDKSRLIYYKKHVYPNKISEVPFFGSVGLIRMNFIS